jgi:hypothetical protein
MPKQKYIEVNRIRYNSCPICKKEIHYPEGVYFRNGIEVHTNCLAIARMRRGKIEGVDY